MQAYEHYVNTLSELFLPFAHLHYETDYTLQLDNASLHTSGLPEEFFEEQQVTVMKWSARSADLYPMENLWSILAARVYANGKLYYSVNELTSAISSSWAAIELETLCILVDSMPSDALNSSSCVGTRPIIR